MPVSRDMRATSSRVRQVLHLRHRAVRVELLQLADLRLDADAARLGHLDHLRAADAMFSSIGRCEPSIMTDVNPASIAWRHASSEPPWSRWTATGTAARSAKNRICMRGVRVAAVLQVGLVRAEDDRRAFLLGGFDDGAGDVVGAAVGVDLHDAVAVAVGVADERGGVDEGHG